MCGGTDTDTAICILNLFSQLRLEFMKFLINNTICSVEVVSKCNYCVIFPTDLHIPFPKLAR